MITEDTVFILGAGASKPYGYPTAAELKQKIINNAYRLLEVRLYNDYKDTDISHRPILATIKNLIDDFAKSWKPSIDLFLTLNPEYIQYGKQIISLLLGMAEKETKLNSSTILEEENWYAHLLHQMTKEITNTEDFKEIYSNKITIVTFNYDRSFEQFLYDSLMHSYIGKRSEVLQYILEFDITHVYGKLAPLPYENKIKGIRYGDREIVDFSSENSENLKIMYSERDGNISVIENKIKNAKNIYFLGFGFAKENLAAIGLDKNLLSAKQNIFGTAYGLTNNEIYTNKSKLASNTEIVEKIIFENCDSLKLLRNYLTV